MNDEEIMGALRRADALLAEYRLTVQPVADELASRKSLYVLGTAGNYAGRLGCFEEGIQKICLHWQGVNPPKESEENRALDFETDWSRRAQEAGLKFVYIGGFY